MHSGNRLRRCRVGAIALLVLASLLPGGAPALGQVRPCCIGSTCTLRTQSACESAGGDWLGTGSSCSPNPCASPPGTCCNGTSCTLVTDAQCTTGGGSFLGGTSCSPNPCSGSCCNGGVCTITASSTCVGSGGAWLRFGSCAPNICPGPCCSNGTCTVTVQSLCTIAAGEVWSPGAGSACFPNPCAAPQCDFKITADTGGLTTGVARVGTSGLLVARGTTLELFNAANANAPASFVPPRRILLPAPAVKIIMSAGSSRAFVLLENFDIFYVTVLSSPQLLFDDTGLIGGVGVNDIESDGDRVYIPRTTVSGAGFDSDVFIYERGADGLPRLLGQFEPGLENFSIDRVAKVGSVLWLGMHFFGSSTYAIESWDVSNPAAPVRRGTILGFAQGVGETEITGLQAIGTRLLVSFDNAEGGALAGDRLRAADVTNPSAPFWHPVVDPVGYVQCMSANGNHLRLGLESSVQTWDATNPAALTLLGTLPLTASPRQLSAGASVDYIASGRDGLQTASFTLPAFPQFRATLTSLPMEVGLVRQSGNLTVVYDFGASTLRVFDYTLSEGQQLRGSLAIPFNYYYTMEIARVSTGSQILACLGGSVNAGIRVVEITNPAAPVLRATINETATVMSATNARLYVLTNGAALKVFDLTSPASPSLLSTTQYGGTSFDYTSMASWESGGTRAVALGTASFGLWLIDATNGASPQVASVYSPGAGFAVTALLRVPGFLYVASRVTFPSTRLESLDVANLANPILHYVTAGGLGAGAPGEFRGLAYSSGATGRFLIGVGASGQSLGLFDIGSPLGEGVPHRIFSLSVPLSDERAALSLDNTRVFLASGDAGVHQLALPQTWAPGFSAPTFAEHEGCLGGAASFHVQASANPATITYQWFRSGNPSVALANGPTAAGSVVSGATTPTLTISNIRPQEAGAFYFCRATNTCGSRDTALSQLVVCIADINCSGTLTVQDIFDFLAAYFAGNLLADVNGSGALSVQDIFDFLAEYFEGCA